MIRHALVLLLLFSLPAQAGDGHHHHGWTPDSCSSMMAWDPTIQMCQPLPMAGMPMSMLMVHGNIYGGFNSAFGARARQAWFTTDMVMADLGTSVGDSHYLAVDLMLSSEKWTLPATGYPLLFQIGEEDQNGNPFTDAQHPHNSPIMGITFSDTIRLTEDRNYLKLYFAPRGEATDGPVAFMHRASALMNPDAPLGHHIGQDVGHVTSTVIGGALQWHDKRFELSTFNGTEPSPTKVDLPIDVPNSLAGRFTEQWCNQLSTMISLAYVRRPEPGQPQLDHVWRYSGSAYLHYGVLGDWMLDDALIYGGISPYDAAAGTLHSFLEEFRLHNEHAQIWGRVEILERTPALLGVFATSPNNPIWITAVTLGYTHIITHFQELAVGVGASVSKDFVPAALSAAYGGNPWAAKVFLYAGGMKMWDF